MFKYWRDGGGHLNPENDDEHTHALIDISRASIKTME